MKILHTADWHMGDYLGRIDRSEEIIQSLEQVDSYLKTYNVDVMIVAGDLFNYRNRPAQIQSSIGEIKRIFLPFLQSGGTIIAVSGNHDHEIFIQALRDTLDLAIVERGRFHLAPEPESILVDGVQFALMPYPTAHAYLGGTALNYKTVAEKNGAILDGFKAKLAEIQSSLNPQLPKILVAHIHDIGSSVRIAYRMSEGEEVLMDVSNFADDWDYVAFGHIHKPQYIRAKHVRYSGSVVRLDAGEIDDDKSVALFEINQQGLVSEPVLLPIESDPIYRIEIDESDISHLAKICHPASKALVHYTLNYNSIERNHYQMAKEIESILPRWYGREFVNTNQLNQAHVEENLQRIEDIAETVKRYLDSNLTNHPRGREILELADQLLAKEGI